MSDQLNDMIGKLQPHELAILKWRLQRRPEQKAPDPLPLLWFLLGGRGSGKTKTGANHIFELACNLPWTSKNREVRVALVGNIFDDVKKTMIEGDSGLLGVIPEECVTKWNRTIGELHVLISGPDGESRKIIFNSYTATSPDKLRGPQFHLAWCDEVAKFEDSNSNPMERDTTWSNLILGLRLGEQPHMVITGTPTPCKLVLYILDHPNCKVSKMTTWANRDNLPQNYREELERLDPNSRTYRQEVMAEVLLDNPNALFSEETIDRDRRLPTEEEQEELRKVLAYDPAMGSGDESDEAGVMLLGYTPEIKEAAKSSANGGGRPIITKQTEAFVLQDLSGHLTPSEQVDLVVKTILSEKVGDLILEVNQGVDFVITQLSQALKDQTADFTINKRRKARKTDFGPVKRFDVVAQTLDGQTHKFLISAIQATKNKKTRAETATYQYDFGRVHHPPKGYLPTCNKETCATSLESELTGWNPEATGSRSQSPNRMDALVYGIFFIFGRHAVHSNTNSKIISPIPMTDQQKNPGKTVIKASSIYSLDVGGASGRMDPSLFERLYNR